MGNGEQFLEDLKTNEGLRAQFRAGINKCREEKDLDHVGAILKIAKSLGYELTEEEAKEFAENRRRKADANSKDDELGEEELSAVAGGLFCNCCVCGTSCEVHCY